MDYAAADARVAARGAGRGAHAMRGVFGATSARAAQSAGGRVDAYRDAS
jgi:acetaldehyde dehydrogenase (acetylating)